MKYLIDANYNKYLQNELLPRSCTCSAVTDKTGNPICLVHVSMTSATGFELAWAKLAQSSSEKKKKKRKEKGNENLNLSKVTFFQFILENHTWRDESLWLHLWYNASLKYSILGRLSTAEW